MYDIHQMGGNGARMFVPPFADPVNPNLDGMLVAAINEVGAVMAGALADSGYTGVAHQIDFDLWWHGGNSHRAGAPQHDRHPVGGRQRADRVARPARARARCGSRSGA